MRPSRGTRRPSLSSCRLLRTSLGIRGPRSFCVITATRHTGASVAGRRTVVPWKRMTLNAGPSRVRGPEHVAVRGTQTQERHPGRHPLRGGGVADHAGGRRRHVGAGAAAVDRQAGAVPPCAGLPGGGHLLLGLRTHARGHQAGIRGGSHSVCDPRNRS